MTARAGRGELKRTIAKERTMRPKTISVILFDEDEAKWLIEQTTALAAACDAHVIALNPFSPILYAGGFATDPTVFGTLQEWETEQSQALRTAFEDRLRRDGVAGEFRSQESMFGAEPFLLSAARGSDLVVIGANRPDRRSLDERTLVERLIRDMGRPVMMLSPEKALGGFAKRLLIGWSETREATRAAHDALALAAPGAEIELVTITAHEGDHVPGLSPREDLAAALDRHGFKVRVTDRIEGAENRANDLVAAADAAKADLLVSGAFGHSRTYDFVIGAVTRDLLSKAERPLFLSK
jgi:nucleotide-binding universal stress UspA family protein